MEKQRERERENGYIYLSEVQSYSPISLREAGEGGREEEEEEEEGGWMGDGVRGEGR